MCFHLKTSKQHLFKRESGKLVLDQVLTACQIMQDATEIPPSDSPHLTHSEAKKQVSQGRILKIESSYTTFINFQLPGVVRKQSSIVLSEEARLTSVTQDQMLGPS